MDQAKINNVVNSFFNSLKTEQDKMLDTGLTHNNTVEIIRGMVLHVVRENPKRFEQYVKFFEFSCMYLQEDTDEIPEVENNG